MIVSDDNVFSVEHQMMTPAGESFHFSLKSVNQEDVPPAAVRQAENNNWNRSSEDFSAHFPNLLPSSLNLVESVLVRGACVRNSSHDLWVPNSGSNTVSI
jgi:hypothetical protein